ncbi:hypothetical protein [Nocardioides sp.]|uniref:hypothetical protein n=1 Tax=Nocardioides sp. TaxID=35761 RepID=UPI003528245B
MSINGLATRTHTSRGARRLAAVAAALACVAVGLPASQALADTGTDPVLGAWVLTGYTDPQTSPDPPADPDDQSGEDNILNVVQLGERSETVVPGTTVQESTGWVTEQPEGEGWVQVDERLVVDQEEIAATPDTWVDRVWHVYAGNNSSDVAPPVDDPHWQATGADPQSANHAFENHTPNVPYSVDRANDHGSDWFLWTATLVPGTAAQEGVAHQEFVFERTVTTADQTLYQWAIYERTNTPGQPGTDDSTETEVQDDNATRQPATSPRHQRASERAVPLSVDAGL